MDVVEALKSRYTCRAFKPDPLEREKLLAIMDAANRTPSWANTQPWEIFAAGGGVLEELRRRSLENFRQGIPANSDLPRANDWPPVLAQRMRELMADRSMALGIDRQDDNARRQLSEQNYRFFGAPAVVYLCMDSSLTPWSIHDLGMLSASIILAATALDVQSAIAYNLVTYPDLIREILKIPHELAIIIGIALGYAQGGDPQNTFRSQRRPLEEVVRLTGF